jgi:hypothetical protein
MDARFRVAMEKALAEPASFVVAEYGHGMDTKRPGLTVGRQQSSYGRYVMLSSSASRIKTLKRAFDLMRK